MFVRRKGRVNPYWQGPYSEGEAALEAWRLPVFGIAPSFVYLPQDINTGTGAWPCHLGLGPSLALTGTAPTYDLRSPFDGGSLLDEAILCNGGRHAAASGTPAIGTDDGVWLFALRHPTIGGAHQVHCGTVSTGGWELDSISGGDTLRFYFQGDGASVVALPPAATIVSGEVNILVAAINRDGGANGLYLFANATPGTAIDADGEDGAPGGEGQIVIGDNAGGTLASSAMVFGVAMWKGAGMFSSGATGAAEMQTIATDLTRRFGGLWARKGPTDASMVPTVTRATAAEHVVSRSSVKKIWHFGKGLFAATDKGVPVYAATTNYALQSHTHNAADWTQLKLTPTDGSIDGPEAFSFGSLWTESTDVGAEYHSIYPDVNYAITGPVECAVFVKRKTSGRDWFQIVVKDASANFSRQYVDLATPTWGTTVNGAGCTTTAYAIETDYPDGWMLVRAFFAMADDIETVYWQPCAADNDSSNYQGDGRDCFYVSDVQIAVGAYPHPIVPTAGAAVTQNAVALSYPIAAIPTAGPFTIEIPFTLPDHTPDAARYLFSVSDGTSDHHLSASVATDGSIDVDSNEDGGDAGHIDLAGDYADGAEHTLRVAVGGGALYAYVDGGAVGTDSSATFPASLTSYIVGARYDGTLSANGHIALDGVKVWSGIRL